MTAKVDTANLNQNRASTPDFRKEPVAWEICSGCKKEYSRLYENGLCYDCQETNEKKEQQAKKFSKILTPKGYYDYTFEKFIVTEENKEAYRKAFEFDPKVQNLFFWGPTGTGKSHLAYAIAGNALRNGLSVEIHKASHLFRNFRETEGRKQIELIDHLTDIDVLVIDEIGLDRDTENTNKVLYEIVDGRIMKMKGGLVTTGNLSLNDFAIKSNDSRIADRFAGSCDFLKLDGKSWRVRLRERQKN